MLWKEISLPCCSATDSRWKRLPPWCLQWRLSFVRPTPALTPQLGGSMSRLTLWRLVRRCGCWQPVCIWPHCCLLPCQLPPGLLYSRLLLYHLYVFCGTVYDFNKLVSVVVRDNPGAGSAGRDRTHYLCCSLSRHGEFPYRRLAAHTTLQTRAVPNILFVSYSVRIVGRIVYSYSAE